MKRFWGKVDPGGREECWIWKAGMNNNGYGRFRLNNKSHQAHRVAWELAHGPVPDGAWVLHRCDNKRCVNPSHLFLGDHNDNMADAVSKGKFDKRGEKNGHSKLIEFQVREIRMLAKTGMLHRELSALFGVSRGQISQIVRRSQWKHIQTED